MMCAKVSKKQVCQDVQKMTHAEVLMFVRCKTSKRYMQSRNCCGPLNRIRHAIDHGSNPTKKHQKDTQAIITPNPQGRGHCMFRPAVKLVRRKALGTLRAGADPQHVSPHTMTADAPATNCQSLPWYYTTVLLQRRMHSL